MNTQLLKKVIKEKLELAGKMQLNLTSPYAIEILMAAILGEVEAFENGKMSKRIVKRTIETKSLDKDGMIDVTNGE